MFLIPGDVIVALSRLLHLDEQHTAAANIIRHQPVSGNDYTQIFGKCLCMLSIENGVDLWKLSSLLLLFFVVSQ